MGITESRRNKKNEEENVFCESGVECGSFTWNSPL